MITVESIWTDRLEDAGINYRAYFVVRIVKEDGSREWHYFGTTEAQFPRVSLEPNRTDLQTLPFFEHTYVSFPSAFNDLPNEERANIYSIAIPSGLNREGEW